MMYFIIIIVSICGIWDFKKRRIPNYVTLPLLLICLIYHVIMGSILVSVVGFGIAFLLGIVCFLLKGMGGGDVKLIAVIGAYFGTYIFLRILFVACIIVILWWTINLIKWKIKNLKTSKSINKNESKQEITVPFGTCLSIALIYLYPIYSK